MTLTVSYGLDGTTGQSTYKERFNEPEPKCLDRFLFVATIIPLQMSDESRRIIWRNHNPQSVTQLKRPKGNGDMQAAKRDCNAPPTRDPNIWICGR